MTFEERFRMRHAARGRVEQLHSIITGEGIGRREEVVCDLCTKHVTWFRYDVSGVLVGSTQGEPRQVQGEGEYCRSCQQKIIRSKRDSNPVSGGSHI